MASPTVKIGTRGRSLTEGTNQPTQATLEFVVHPIDTNAAPATEREAIAAVLAEYNLEHPDYPELVVSGWDVSNPDDDGVYVVQATYGPGRIPDLGGNDIDIDDNDPGFIDFSLRTTTRWFDIYRELTTISPIAALAATEGYLQRPEVGGWPIDSLGEPVSGLLRQQELTVTQVIDTTLGFPVYFNLAGSRNAAPMWGAPTGFLLYLGANSARRVSPGVYRIDHRFVYDEFAHLRMSAKLANDGRPKTGIYTFGVIPVADVAVTVFWVQPYPRLEDFTQIGLPDVL